MRLPSTLRGAHRDEGGQTVILVALLFTLLLGFAGLAIDAGRFYAERRFLQNAVDAAALGCVAKLTVGGTQTQAEDQGKAILRSYNLPGDPTGTGVVVSETPLRNTWFNSDPNDWRNLYDGVHAGTTDCRAAVLASMQTYFMRLLGIATLEVPATAHAAAKGGMLPVVVNRYKDPPGPSRTFIDYTKQEGFQNSNPDTCFENGGRVGGGTCPDALPGDYSVDGSGQLTCSTCLWGPETVVAGQGYQSSDSDFRGFIALDIRDFTSTNRTYYNGVTPTTNTNSLKDQEASYVNGGYPGPDLVAYVPGSNPVQAELQIATMAGNASGVVVSNFAQYFKIGERILVQLFDGQVREIPEFTINAPSQIAATADGVSRTGPTFRVGANQRFRDANDTVGLAMLRDTFNVSSTDTPAQLHDLHFNPGSEPNPPYAGRFTPAGGSGTQVQIVDLQVDSGLAAGIYSVVIKGQGYDAFGGQLSKKESWVPLNVGGVTRDFTMSFSSTVAEVAWGPNIATFTLDLSTGSSAQAWGASGVTFAIDQDTCALGYARLTNANPFGNSACVLMTPITPAVPSKNNPPTVTVPVPVNGVDQGTYTLVLRGRGTNSDGQPVVHVQQLTIGVGTSVGATTKYVNVQGYAAFVISSVTSNTVMGRAVSAYYADPKDPALNVTHKAGLIPWEIAPY